MRYNTADAASAVLPFGGEPPPGPWPDRAGYPCWQFAPKRFTGFWVMFLRDAGIKNKYNTPRGAEYLRWYFAHQEFTGL